MVVAVILSVSRTQILRSSCPVNDDDGRGGGGGDDDGGNGY